MLKDGKIDEAIHKFERSVSSLVPSKFDDICAQANVGVTNPNNLCTPSDLEAHDYTLDKDGSLISPSGEVVVRKLNMTLDKDGNLVDDKGVIRLHAAQVDMKAEQKPSIHYGTYKQTISIDEVSAKTIHLNTDEMILINRTSSNPVQFEPVTPDICKLGDRNHGDSGIFSLRGIKAGRCEVRITAEGDQYMYQPATATFTFNVR